MLATWQTSRDRSQSRGARDSGRAGTAGLSPGWGLHSSRHLSQCQPAVAPRQAWQVPVSGWHASVCPLQAQGWQRGKPQWPWRQRSQRRPARLARQGQCPLIGSQAALVAPSEWQPHSLQPPGPRPYVPGTQRSQVRPVMLGRQGHCPPSRAHSALSEPWGWHSHARPPPWSRAEMLHTRRAQAADVELERPVLAASRQPVAWSSCRRPAAPVAIAAQAAPSPGTGAHSNPEG